MKTIPWNKYFQKVEDDIITYRIVPDKTVDNNTIILSKAMAEIYNTPKDRVTLAIKGVKFTYRIKEKTYFDIILEPKMAHFFLSVHSRWAKFIELKMQNIWPKCAIEEVPQSELNGFNSSHCAVCDIRLRKHNIFSLKTTTKDLDPLNSMLAVLHDMTDGDKVRVSFVFDSMNRNDWVTNADGIYKKYKKGIVPRRAQITRADMWQGFWKSAEVCLNWYIQMRMLIIDGMMSCLSLGRHTEDEKLENILTKIQEKDMENKKLLLDGSITRDTLCKIKSPVFNTNIRIVSKSPNSERRTTNLHTVANSFKDLTGDNELQTVELTEKGQKKRLEQVLNFKKNWSIDKNILSDEEVSKMIQLPQITLQLKHNLNSIDTREIKLPQEILEGNISIGTANYKQKAFTTYWPTDKNLISLPKVVIGPMGSGKSEYTIRFAREAKKAGHGCIVFDYIKDCDLSERIKTPDSVVINMADMDNLFALAYPEIEPGEDKNDRLRAANLLSRQMEYLINSLTTEVDMQLKPRMSRYLDAASKVVFIHKGAKVADVFNVLIDAKVRMKYIQLAQESGCFGEGDTEIDDLESLNDYQITKVDNIVDGKKVKTEVKALIGTNESKIEGIIDRLSMLNKDIYLRAMMKADINYEHNFSKWMNEGKTVLIQMPENVFTSKQVKDTICTYFMGRVWLSALTRGQSNIVHIITDEAHQVPTAATLLTSVITEGRKFGIDFYFTIHYLKQFKLLHDAVKSSGVSYMLLAGTEKENLKLLEEEIKPFNISEGLELKKFHSLNIIKTSDQYMKFISKLPNPI